MDSYRRLHETANGGPVRPSATYDCQREAFRADQARLYGAGSKSGWCWLGFVYCYVFKNRAYYASGPSVEKNVMHALLWHAICACQAEGLRTFEVGWVGRATDQKGQGVEAFKRAWSGQREPMWSVEWNR